MRWIEIKDDCIITKNIILIDSNELNYISFCNMLASC